MQLSYSPVSPFTPLGRSRAATGVPVFWAWRAAAKTGSSSPGMLPEKPVPNTPSTRRAASPIREGRAERSSVTATEGGICP